MAWELVHITFCLLLFIIGVYEEWIPTPYSSTTEQSLKTGLPEERETTKSNKAVQTEVEEVETKSDKVDWSSKSSDEVEETIKCDKAVQTERDECETESDEEYSISESSDEVIETIKCDKAVQTERDECETESDEEYCISESSDEVKETIKCDKAVQTESDEECCTSESLDKGSETIKSDKAIQVEIDGLETESDEEYQFSEISDEEKQTTKYDKAVQTASDECETESDEEHCTSESSDDDSWKTVKDEELCRKSKKLSGSTKKLYGLQQVNAERRELFEKNNRRRPKNVIDLHGLRRYEALGVVYECLTGIENDRFYKHVDIITGKGNHSVYGIPRIKPAVRKFLKSRGTPYIIVDQNPGMLRVLIR